MCVLFLWFGVTPGCSQKLLLVGFGGSFTVVGIKPGMAMCKASALPSVSFLLLLLRLWGSWSVCEVEQNREGVRGTILESIFKIKTRCPVQCDFQMSDNSLFVVELCLK